MDEKGDEALGMDDAPEEENESRETSGHDVSHSARQNDLKSGQTTSITDEPHELVKVEKRENE